MSTDFFLFLRMISLYINPATFFKPLLQHGRLARIIAFILAPLRAASHSGNGGGHMTQASPIRVLPWE